MSHAVPIEPKRRRGNPGKRALPDPATTQKIKATHGEVPDHHRPLGEIGKELWERIWAEGYTWVSSSAGERDYVLQLCEMMDERHAARAEFMRTKYRLDASTVRHLDAEIDRRMNKLGFTPASRAVLGVAELEEQAEDEIAEMRERRRAHLASLGLD